MFGESAGPEVQHSGREAFLIDTHYVICDCFSQELKRRKDEYKKVEEKFGFLTKTKSMDIEQIRAATEKLKKIHPQDLEEDPESCHYLTHIRNTQRTAHPTNGHASLGNGGGNTTHNKQHTNNKDPKPVNPT